jgi:hypothetical protein
LLVLAFPAHAQAPAPAEANASILVAEFRGKVAYFGNHSGMVVTPLRAGETRRPNARCPRPEGTCPDPIGGSLQVELVFEGDIVHGSFRGTGGLADGTLIGRRLGASCRLFDMRDGSVWAGRCDTNGFTGTIKSVPNASVQLSVSFETVGTRTIDYAERDARRRAAIERARRIEWLVGQMNGLGPVEQRLDALLQLDSERWTTDRYQPGSLYDVKRSKTDNDGHDYIVQGKFSLEGGRTGWVRAQVRDDQFACLETSDRPGTCRSFRRPVPPPIPSEDEDDAAVPGAQPQDPTAAS